MNKSNRYKIVSLFSGCGGLDLGFDYDGVNHFEKSFIVAISVIVIACPCALALATPIAKVYCLKKLSL